MHLSSCIINTIESPLPDKGNLRIYCEMKSTHTSQSEALLVALWLSALVVRPVLETAALLVFVSTEEKPGW